MGSVRYKGLSYPRVCLTAHRAIHCSVHTTTYRGVRKAQPFAKHYWTAYCLPFSFYGTFLHGQIGSTREWHHLECVFVVSPAPPRPHSFIRDASCVTSRTRLSSRFLRAILKAGRLREGLGTRLCQKFVNSCNSCYTTLDIVNKLDTLSSGIYAL